ncbi:MAG: DNA polymerase III subunit alpha, partial [Burkholderiaceae bacterium]|nr:DNA polymerase III subunit alpha [Burkholderiaceae bacterium]
RSLIRDDELIIALAKVSKDEYSGGMRVVAERVLDLTGARQEFGKRLRISLNGVADAALLRGAIEPYAGISETPLPVLVEYGNEQGRCAVELGERWRVCPRDDLLADVRRRLHPIAVQVDY